MRRLPETRERLVPEHEYLYLPHETYKELIGVTVQVAFGPFAGAWGHISGVGRLRILPARPNRKGEHTHLPVQFDKPVRGISRAYVRVEALLND